MRACSKIASVYQGDAKELVGLIDGFQETD